MGRGAGVVVDMVLGGGCGGPGGGCGGFGPRGGLGGDGD